MAFTADLIVILTAPGQNGSKPNQTQNPSEITAFSQVLKAITKGQNQSAPAAHANSLGPAIGAGNGRQMALAANAINELIAPQPAAQAATTGAGAGATGDTEFNQIMDAAAQADSPNAGAQAPASPGTPSSSSQRGGRKALDVDGDDAASLIANAATQSAPAAPNILPNVTAMNAASKAHQKGSAAASVVAPESSGLKPAIEKAPLTVPAASSAAAPNVPPPAIAALEQHGVPQPAAAGETAQPQGAISQANVATLAPEATAAAGASPLVVLQLMLRSPSAPGAATADASVQLEEFATTDRLSGVVPQLRAPPKANANAAAFKSALKSAASSPVDGVNSPASAPGSERAEAGSNSQLSPSQAATLTQVGAYADRAIAAAHRGDAPSAGAQVAHEIVRRAASGATHFEVRLDPPELGRVDVRLEISRDHRVTAIVAADNPQALAELARHARDLEQSLLAAGLMLGEDGLSFDLRQGGESAAETNANQSGALDGADGVAEMEETPLSARPLGFERWRGVRVDIWI